MAKMSRVDTRTLDRIIRNSDGNIADILMGAGIEMLGDIRLSFNTSPNYELNGRIGSAPGYPPNIDTAALTNSMHVEQETPRRVIIADGVLYGIHLEQGTDTIAPRPFVAPVFENWRQRRFGQYLMEQEIVKI